jgi:hypothetical protein
MAGRCAGGEALRHVSLLQKAFTVIAANRHDLEGHNEQLTLDLR